MYLQPWQIFVMGCIVGILIAIILLISIIANLIKRNGVTVVKEKEKDTNE